MIRGVFAGIIVKGQCSDGCCQEVIEVLDRLEICLITFPGQAAGVIQIKEMKKPPVRMWLFGLITIAEMILSSMLERFCPADRWQTELPEGRLDKGSNLTKNPSIREELGFKTRSEAR